MCVCVHVHVSWCVVTVLLDVCHVLVPAFCSYIYTCVSVCPFGCVVGAEAEEVECFPTLVFAVACMVDICELSSSILFSRTWITSSFS